MRAARWDTTWEAGGLWRVTLRWRIGGTTGDPAVMDEGRMELWPTSAGPPDDPAMVVDGATNDDGSLTLARSSAQTAAAAPGQYRHRVLVHDPAVDDMRVLLRGFVTIAPPEASP